MSPSLLRPGRRLLLHPRINCWPPPRLAAWLAFLLCSLCYLLSDSPSTRGRRRFPPPPPRPAGVVAVISPSSRRPLGFQAQVRRALREKKACGPVCGNTKEEEREANVRVGADGVKAKKIKKIDGSRTKKKRTDCLKT